MSVALCADVAGVVVKPAVFGAAVTVDDGDVAGEVLCEEAPHDAIPTTIPAAAAAVSIFRIREREPPEVAKTC